MWAGMAVSIVVALILMMFSCTFSLSESTEVAGMLQSNGKHNAESNMVRTCTNRELHVFITLTGRNIEVPDEVYENIRKLLTDLTKRRAEPPCNASSTVQLFIYQHGNDSFAENNYALSCDFDDRERNCTEIINKAVTRLNLENISDNYITDCFDLFTTLGQKFVQEYDMAVEHESCKQFLLITNIISTCIIAKYGIIEMLENYMKMFPKFPFPLSAIILPIFIGQHVALERYSVMFPSTKLHHLIVPHKPEQLVTRGLPYLDFCNNHLPIFEIERNETSEAPPAHPAQMEISKSNSLEISVAIAATVLCFCMLLCCAGLTIWTRRKRCNEREEVIYELATRSERCFSVTSRISTVTDNISYSYSILDQPRNKYEIAPELLFIDRTSELGKGAFAVVFKGHLIGAAPVIGMVPSLTAQYYQNCSVAVKTVLEHADETQRAQFLREIAILTKLGFHNHIVNLLGCVTTGQEKYLVMELAEMNLLEYIRSLTNEHPPLRCLLSIAWQIADGMTFISSRHFIHCDLAARNILLTGGQKAMIGDFGLCQHSESGLIKKSFGKLPIRHLALESLKKHEFSEKSDVWSFGVVLYEMYSRGKVPYEAIGIKDISDHLFKGTRLERPELAYDEIYDIMQSTWKATPSDRPNFSQIRSSLADHLEKSTDYYGYIHAREDISCTELSC